MVINATFNNISVTSWLSVSLVEKTGIPGEKLRPAATIDGFVLVQYRSQAWNQGNEFF
jgi:hypothetical protein